MIRLLVLSYHYEPYNSMATHRAVAYAKHLPEYGVHPVVVTHAWNNHQQGEAHWHIQQGGPLEVEHHPDHTVVRLPLPAGTMPHTGGYVRTLKALCKGQFDLGGYLPASRQVYRDFLQSNHPELDQLDGVLSIFNPHHHLELGAQFAQSRAVPFCADLRDLWGADAGTERLYSGWKHRLREWLVKRYWKKWLTQAHLVSTVTPTWGHTLAHFLGTPVTTVRNGIEAGAFEHADQVVPNTFTLAYVGSLYAEQDLAPLAKALAALPKHYKWQFQWIGAPHACAIEQLRTQLSAYGLDKERIQGKTRTSRSEALGWMRGAQILVYPAWPNQPGVIGGKVYEYLASGTPVVITAPNRQQDVVELASSVTSAAVFTTEDGVALTEWLRSKHNDWAANPTAQRDLNTAPFERSTQVAVWAAAFFEKQKG